MCARKKREFQTISFICLEARRKNAEKERKKEGERKNVTADKM
jgi:hypothetical protein